MEKQIKTELTTNPSVVKVDQPTELIVTVKDREGTVLRDFVINHERLMHLLLVSDDLNIFDHLHPQHNQDGSFRITHTFQYGGNYWLYADFVPSHEIGPSIERFDLWIDGNKQLSPKKLENASNKTSKVDGLSISLKHEEPLRPKKNVHLLFFVTDAQTGRPVNNLQPYLGALAHIVIISHDGSEFLHTHPIEHAVIDHEQHSHSKQTSRNQEINNQIGALTVFPHSGIYKMWVQLQRDGKVITAPFVINVDK